MNPESSHRPQTIDLGGKRVWIHPQEMAGRFGRLRIAIAVPLLVFFYALPWCTWHGNPILRLSLSSQSFFFLGSPLLIQEFYHFVLLFILAILSLFLASALWGRIWCGYGCPQTIFIEQILRRIERLVEGPAAHRKVADAGKLTGKRIAQKILKQFLFFLVSFSFGLTLVLYFVDPVVVFSFSSTSSLVAVGLFTALAWFDGAYWREQFCHLVCPYARFQSLMLSRATTTIGYDKKRGEPRRKGKLRDSAGDCIDCGLCVRVCPSGIDIRQGVNQLECTACARCIDACDSVMSSMQKPIGLIRYDSEENLQNGTTKNGFLEQIKNPRVIVLGFICVSLFMSGLIGFFQRQNFRSQILTVPGVPFVTDGERVKNIYTVRIGNQSPKHEKFRVQLKDAGDAKIESPTELGSLSPGEEKMFPLMFSIDKNSLQTSVTVVIESSEGVLVLEQQRAIMMPGRSNK